MNETEANTLGLRIQAGRKAAGMSQEALGEQLGVSRQAVSKWESDAAIPELENLIAMSRLFGVSIGALLGVEQADEAPSLSEQELAAVEVIAQKYGPRRKWAIPLAAASGLVVIGLFCALFFKIAALEDNIESVRAGIPGASTIVIPQQDTTTGVLLESSADVTTFDLAGNSITLNAYGVAREWSETTRGIFTARFRDGREYTLDTDCVNGQFTATDWTLPWYPEDGLDLRLSLSLMDDGSARSDTIFLPNYSPDEFRLQFYGGVGINVDTRGNVAADADSFAVISVSMNYYPALDAYPVDLHPTAIDLCIFRNDETEPESVTPLQPGWLVKYLGGEIAPLPLEQAIDGCFNINMDVNVPVKIGPDDAVVPVIRVTDNYGRYSYNPTTFYTTDDEKVVYEHSLYNGWLPGASPWEYIFLG